MRHALKVLEGAAIITILVNDPFGTLFCGVSHTIIVGRKCVLVAVVGWQLMRAVVEVDVGGFETVQDLNLKVRFADRSRPNFTAPCRIAVGCSNPKITLDVEFSYYLCPAPMVKLLKLLSNVTKTHSLFGIGT